MRVALHVRGVRRPQPDCRPRRLTDQNSRRISLAWRHCFCGVRSHHDEYRHAPRSMNRRPDPAASIRSNARVPGLDDRRWPVRGGPDAKNPDSLRRFSESVESLNPAVCPGRSGTSHGIRSSRERRSRRYRCGDRQAAQLGSGVIIDRDGYIVTNAHVVAGAVRDRSRRYRQLNERPALAGERARSHTDATIVGTAPD